jgi:predicted MPP superfamily phosphohydrolase
MARAIHISDMHAGREDGRIVEELLLDIEQLSPDIVLAGGDFTQRSRSSQWKKASGWLQRITAPVLAVPGNHDIPLFDVGRRVADPFGRYRSHIALDLEPEPRSPTHSSP